MRKERIKYLLGVFAVCFTMVAITITGTLKAGERIKGFQEEIYQRDEVILSLHTEISELQNDVYQVSTQLEESESEKESLRQELEEQKEISKHESMYTMVMEATAYSNDPITATGTVPRVHKTLAVDPNVIPLGSEVYVEGFGWMVAEDTGRLIKNDIIDIYMGSKKEARAWGRRNVRIYVKGIDN